MLIGPAVLCYAYATLCILCVMTVMAFSDHLISNCTSVCQCALRTVEYSCLYELFLDNYLKMLSRQFARNAQLRITTRCFTRSNVIRETNKDKIPAQKSNVTVKETDGVIGSRMHRVTDFDKRMLVWVKRYPSFADVPKDVTEDCILTARNKARIKTCNYLIAITLIGCLIAVILGKKGAARGENLFKQREDWLRERLEQDKNK